MACGFVWTDVGNAGVELRACLLRIQR